MIQYGLISNVDAETIQKTLDIIMYSFGGEINTCEVGIFNGETSRGIHKYILDHGNENNHTAIDSQKDFATQSPFPECTFIIGNSTEVYNQLINNSQHFIFIDGLHTFPGVIADFYCYSQKVKVGGFLAFHDTGAHIQPLHGWQLVGDPNDTDMCLAVRKALTTLGLYETASFVDTDINDATPIGEVKNLYNQRSMINGDAQPFVAHNMPGWKLVFDEADINDEAGGITVFKRLF